MIWMIAIAALLLVPGCSKKGAQDANQPESTQNVGQPVTIDETAQTGIQEPAEKNEVDPAFNDYIYPGSKLDGKHSMGGSESLMYMSKDDFNSVVEYYKQKFPDTNVGSGTTVYFGKENPDGSSLTVTLTKMDYGTQVILNLTKKP